jgi:hypothetical protein
MVSPAPQTLLAGKQGSARQFILATMPLLGAMVFFLIRAQQIPSLPVYNLPAGFTDDQWNAAVEESGLIASLLDILVTFMIFHLLWTIFAVYTIMFIPKRRHLIGRYLAEGELCLGDVVYDKSSRFCGGLREYGYAIYAHPNRQYLIRKRVRVYQSYTRERVAILRLPNRPLSGQCQIDLEIDLNAAVRERDSSLKYIVQWALFWVLFTLVGSIFVLFQMRGLQEKAEHGFSSAFKLFLVVVGLNAPVSFAVNWIRWLAYRNWMINRGCLIEDVSDARRVDHCMAARAQSEDGSDIIPYSILSEEEVSYQGTLPSHSSTLNDDYLMRNQSVVA